MIAVTQGEIAAFLVAIFLVISALFVYFLFNLWAERELKGALSPYTKKPLRRARELHYLTKEKVYQFLFKRYEYHNQIIDLDMAAFCRPTGRIFPNCITFWETIRVDWSFLKKRHPGNWVSWGSLAADQKLLIEDKHGSLEGFQTEKSCPNPSPLAITEPYISAKPGPLYVDLESNIIMGWQVVPDTEVEVLIVQKPLREYRPDINQLDKEERR
ncbi:MAG: hypothetical protein WD595_00530 [Waddliaceae bacterium]